MIDGIFEIAMLLCFASAWPFSIYRSYKSRSALGKSLGFLLILMIGYVFGIINKFVVGQVNYVLFFYVLGLCLVTTDCLLYFRNRRLDAQRAARTIYQKRRSVNQHLVNIGLRFGIHEQHGEGVVPVRGNRRPG